MIGNIAHQWRQPLSIISTSATGMQVQKEFGILNDEAFTKSCDNINRNAQYLSKTIDDFKNYIKGDRTIVSFDLEEYIESFILLIESNITKENIEIILDIQNDVQFTGYPNELTQCLINIFNNAKDALLGIEENKRYIFISASFSNERLIIFLKDSAGGIPVDILDKIFEPYFTTKHNSQGTGLGLHMVYDIINQGMKGTISVYNRTYRYKNEDFKGAEFKIEIPALQI